MRPQAENIYVGADIICPQLSAFEVKVCQNPLKHRVSRDFPLVLPEWNLSKYKHTSSGSILPISHLFGKSHSVSKVFRHAEAAGNMPAADLFIFEEIKKAVPLY